MDKSIVWLALTTLLLCGSFVHGAYNVKTMCEDWNTEMSDEAYLHEVLPPGEHLADRLRRILSDLSGVWNRG